MVSRVIKGEKVRIRDRKLADARDEFNWSKDQELAELDAAPPLRMGFNQFLYEFNSDFNYPSPTRRRFAIDTSDGKHIGNCSYYNINADNGEAELGILIGDREYWNKGYGADVINAMLEYIFSRNRFQRVYLKTLEWNSRAQRCFSKCGFKPYGHLEQHGYRFLLMDTHRSDWLSRDRKQERNDTRTAPSG